MTIFEIRTTDGKIRTRARIDADIKPGDTRLALRLLEDECSKRGWKVTEHAIRGHDSQRGWITHGGTR